jgi:hypothetical protein
MERFFIGRSLEEVERVADTVVIPAANLHRFWPVSAGESSGSTIYNSGESTDCITQIGVCATKSIVMVHNLSIFNIVKQIFSGKILWLLNGLR